MPELQCAPRMLRSQATWRFPEMGLVSEVLAMNSLLHQGLDGPPRYGKTYVWQEPYHLTKLTYPVASFT